MHAHLNFYDIFLSNITTNIPPHARRLLSGRAFALRQAQNVAMPALIDGQPSDPIERPP